MSKLQDILLKNKLADNFDFILGRNKLLSYNRNNVLFIGRDIKTILILDVNFSKFFPQTNTIKIRPWTGGRADTCFLWLSSILQKIGEIDTSDIRRDIFDLKDMLI